MIRTFSNASLFFFFCFCQIFFGQMKEGVAAESDEFFELINRNNYVAAEMGLASTLGRIDACKVTTQRNADGDPYQYWLGAEDYFVEALEPYFVLAKLMSDSVNDEHPNSIDISYFTRGGITQSSMYQQRIKEMKGSSECFEFGDGSIYELMGSVGIGFVNLSTQQAWKEFDKRFPLKAVEIRISIEHAFPSNYIFR